MKVQIGVTFTLGMNGSTKAEMVEPFSSPNKPLSAIYSSRCDTFFYKTHRRSGQLLLREYSHLLLKSSMLKNGTKKGGRDHLRNKRRRGREYVEGGDALEAGESERGVQGSPALPKIFVVTDATHEAS